MRQNETKKLLSYILKGIEEKKGDNITVLDLRHLSNAIADYFVICEGGSRPQVQAIVDSVWAEAKKGVQEIPYHTEGEQNGEWAIMDYIDVVVHVFQPEPRQFYALEDLWGDAKACDDIEAAS